MAVMKALLLVAKWVAMKAAKLVLHSVDPLVERRAAQRAAKLAP